MSHKDINNSLTRHHKSVMISVMPFKINTLNFGWIHPSDSEFIKLFKDSVCYVESKKQIVNNLFDAISKQPSNKEKIKEYAQFYTPVDVALYSAYQLLKTFSGNGVVFDPCAGRGSLLIAAGVVLAIKFNMRDEKLLSMLHGSEICAETYDETIDNIIIGLSEWTHELNYTDARDILLQNIKNKDFYNVDIPKKSFVIVNPPYKEVDGKGNLWLSFIKDISDSKSVKSFAAITPVSICSADRTSDIRQSIKTNFSEIIALHHDTRPRPLFKNIEQRITIIIAHKNNNPSYSTTGFLMHKFGERVNVWTQNFITLDKSYCNKVFPKIANSDELIFFYKHFNARSTVSQYVDKRCDSFVWVRTTGRYRLSAQMNKPDRITTKWKKININPEGASFIIENFKNGKALMWWSMFGDGRDISIPKFLNNYSNE